MTDRQMDGHMHTRRDKGHFYSSPPPSSGDNYALTATLYSTGLINSSGKQTGITPMNSA